MPPSRRWVAAGAALFAQLLPASAMTQDRLAFRFAPPDDTPITYLFQTHTRTAGSNGRAYEFADVGVLTELPLGEHDGARVVHLTYDSVRVRAREAGEPWREFLPPNSDSLWMQLRLDDRMHVLGASGQPLPSFTDPVAVVTGMRDLILPDGAVRPGDAWRARTAVPLPRGPGREPGPLAELSAEAVVTLDSLVARAHDTLGYITLTARIDRRTVEDPLGREPGRWSFTGDLSGALVWSTGWSAFVSGSSRVRVFARRRNGPGDGEAVGEMLEWETTTRYRVRP